MPSGPGKLAFSAVFILTTSLSLSASIPTSGIHFSRATAKIQRQSSSSHSHLLDSLRRDVAAHPADFITFETEASALRFIAEHAAEAYRETDPRILSRGIFGYWDGKMLVVLPTLTATTLH